MTLKTGEMWSNVATVENKNSYRRWKLVDKIIKLLKYKLNYVGNNCRAHQHIQCQTGWIDETVWVLNRMRKTSQGFCSHPKAWGPSADFVLVGGKSIYVQFHYRRTNGCLLDWSNGVMEYNLWAVDFAECLSCPISLSFLSLSLFSLFSLHLSVCVSSNCRTVLMSSADTLMFTILYGVFFLFDSGSIYIGLVS